MLRNWLIVGAVAAVGVVAGIHALQGGGSAPSGERAEQAGPKRPERKLRGPDVPAPGALPGTLYVTTSEGCRLRALSLADVSLGERGPETVCKLWVSPTGRLAVVAARESAAGVRKRRELWLARLGDPPALLRELGVTRGEVSWSQDGSRVAWCAEDGNTVVHAVDEGREAELPGCGPRFAQHGTVLTHPLGSLPLLRDGGSVLNGSELASGFSQSGSVTLFDYDEGPDGLLAVAVVSHGSERTEARLELWRGATLEASLLLPPVIGAGGPDVGRILRFSPTGRELAVAFAGRVGLLDLAAERADVPPDDAHDFAWSPDGAWFAVATADEVVVYGAVRSELIYRLPVAALALGWAPAAPEGD